MSPFPFSGAGLVQAQHDNFGFEPQHAMLVGADLKMAGYSRDQVPPMQKRMMDAVETIPGVESVGLSDALLLNDQNPSNIFSDSTTDLRPSNATATAYILHSYSFPSGHAMGSLVGYGMLAYLLVISWADRWQVRVAIVSIAALLILAIGVSRLYLGVHYFSDVVGGYAAGVLWLSAYITGLEIARRQPHSQGPEKRR